MRPLGWLVKNRRMNSRQWGLFIFSLILVLAWAIDSLSSFQTDRGPVKNGNKIYILITGEVKNNGVYVFDTEPSAAEVINRTGDHREKMIDRESETYLHLTQGTGIHVSSEDGHIKITPHPISAFHKVALGIPISLNTATQEEFEAVPYIGPSLANKIIQYRSIYGPFTAVEQIKFLPGVGKVRYSRISPYVGIHNSAGKQCH